MQNPILLGIVWVVSAVIVYGMAKGMQYKLIVSRRTGLYTFQRETDVLVLTFFGPVGILCLCLLAGILSIKASSAFGWRFRMPAEVCDPDYFKLSEEDVDTW